MYSHEKWFTAEFTAAFTALKTPMCGGDRLWGVRVAQSTPAMHDIGNVGGCDAAAVRCVGCRC